MSIPIEIFNKILLYNSHPVSDVFRNGYVEELEDYEFGQTTKYFKFSFYDLFQMKKERREQEDFERWEEIGRLSEVRYIQEIENGLSSDDEE